MAEVYLKSKEEWVQCNIVKENAKSYIVEIDHVEVIEKALKVKDGNVILKNEEVLSRVHITKRKNQVIV